MKELLQQTLAQLRGVAGVRAAMLVDAEAGLPVATTDGAQVNATRVAALATALRGRLVRAAAGAEFGAVSVVEVEGAGGRLLVGGDGELLVVVVADTDASTDALRQEMRGIMEVIR